MRYLPHTEKDVTSMLKTIGANSLDDLFAMVPEDCRFTEPINLPEPLTEWELNDHMATFSGQVATGPAAGVFTGAGSYDHYIPAMVSHLLGRSEFVTAYTPYQPEMSQGTLQAIYEYQTLAARLLGMEVANASLFDGASALAEALLMAVRINRKKTVAISNLIHPLYRRVVETYFKPTDYRILQLPYLENGRTDLSLLDETTNLAAVAVQSPNLFGCIEDLKTTGDIIHDKGALYVTCFTEPLADGLFKNPGSYGADIVCGEGQSLGIPQSFGGPGLGIFAGKMEHARSMPGRLVRMTKDKARREGFVLTLATREQHIRKEKATSNICTNNNLCALATAMYLATLSGKGLKELARLNFDKSEYLKKELKAAGCSLPFESPTFNEFIAALPAGFETTYGQLLRKKIVAGLPLATYFPELAGHYLLCVTETKTREEIDALVREAAS